MSLATAHLSARSSTVDASDYTPWLTLTQSLSASPSRQVDTPLIDAMIRWNQKLIGKEYITASGFIDGADAGECVLPSALGLTKTTLEYGNRSGDVAPPAKKAKA